MGAHSAGRRVRAPGRFRRLNVAAELLFVTALIGAAGYAGWVSFERPPHNTATDPRIAAVPTAPIDPPVAAFTPTTPPTTAGHGTTKDADTDPTTARNGARGSGSCS